MYTDMQIFFGAFSRKYSLSYVSEISFDILKLKSRKKYTSSLVSPCRGRADTFPRDIGIVPATITDNSEITSFRNKLTRKTVNGTDHAPLHMQSSTSRLVFHGSFHTSKPKRKRKTPDLSGPHMKSKWPEIAEMAE